MHAITAMAEKIRTKYGASGTRRRPEKRSNEGRITAARQIRPTRTFEIPKMRHRRTAQSFIVRSPKGLVMGDPVAGRCSGAGGAQNGLRNSVVRQARTEYIIRVRPIVGSSLARDGHPSRTPYRRRLSNNSASASRSWSHSKKVLGLGFLFRRVGGLMRAEATFKRREEGIQIKIVPNANPRIVCT